MTTRMKGHYRHCFVSSLYKRMNRDRGCNNKDGCEPLMTGMRRSMRRRLAVSLTVLLQP